MTKEEKDLLLQIPDKLDDTVCLYVDGKFVDRLDVNQVYQYRINVMKYVYETGDYSILNRFYFIGHKDTNDIPGEEIKIELNEQGELSNYPYEMSHMRRYLWKLFIMEEHFGEIK